MNRPNRLLEEAVDSFIHSVNINFKKADQTEKADFLLTADPEWIVALQTQLSQVYYCKLLFLYNNVSQCECGVTCMQDYLMSCPLDVQLSILDLLNAYFTKAVGEVDLSTWIEVLENVCT